MAYAAITKPSLYMNTKLYTGNATDDTAITGVGFQPDLTWIKTRGSVKHHALFDAVRTATKYVQSNTTTAEGTDATSLKSFDSDGFTLGVGSTLAVVNQDTIEMASWNWKANGSGSANTVGDIASTVSVNTTSGFSIVKFNTDGQPAASLITCGHGLGTVPKMMIFKFLPTVDGWYVYHEATGNGRYMRLDTSGNETANANIWSATTPTSSVFSLNTNWWGSSTNDVIAYCFAEVKGFSKISSYTGNGDADGPFLYTGFKPAFFIMKETTDSSTNWIMYDNKRSTFNPVDDYLIPNESNAEATGLDFDFLSNGIKCRTNNAGINGSGDSYLYMAFAEEPLVANVGVGIPATAR